MDITPLYVSSFHLHFSVHSCIIINLLESLFPCCKTPWLIGPHAVEVNSGPARICHYETQCLANSHSELRMSFRWTMQRNYYRGKMIFFYALFTRCIKLIVYKANCYSQLLLKTASKAKQFFDVCLLNIDFNIIGALCGFMSTTS